MENLIDRAKKFTQQAHCGQKRDDGVTDYFLHLKRVAECVGQFSDDPEVISASYLHDTVEDVGVSVEDIESLFGVRVADIVWALTNEPVAKNETPKDALDRKYFDNARVVEGGEAVWLVKLCDRLDNLNDINGWSKRRVEKYVEKTNDLLNKINEAFITFPPIRYGNAINILFMHINYRMNELCKR